MASNSNPESAEFSVSGEPLKLPARSPNLNAYAERWVKSVKEEALSKLILFGEASLRRALSEYLVHFHQERNHTIKAKATCFCSRRIFSQRPARSDLFAVANGWAGCSSTTIARLPEGCHHARRKWH